MNSLLKEGKPIYLSYTRQGSIQHLTNPLPCNRLLAMENFIDFKDTTPLPEHLSTTDPLVSINQDLLRLFNLQFVKGSAKGIGLMKNQNQQVVLTPSMQRTVLDRMGVKVAIISDPAVETYEETRGTFTEKSKNQERKQHERWFNFVKQIVTSDFGDGLTASTGVDAEGSEIHNSNTSNTGSKDQIEFIACISGTKSESIAFAVKEMQDKLDSNLDGYALVLPTFSNFTTTLTPSDQSKFESNWQSKLLAFKSNLSTSKPTAIFGIQSFKFILFAISQNINVFDNSMVDYMTDQGLAFTVDLDSLEETNATRQSRNEVFFDFNKDRKEWTTDTSPISSSCECWTCKHHHRAYIHHLLCVNDMLAFVLLKRHNEYQFDKFFKDVGKAIDDSSFEQKSKLFVGL